MNATASNNAARWLLDLIGAIGPPPDLWMTYGVRRFVQEWSTAQPGSVRELELLLGLADPQVQVFARSASRNDVRLLINWNRWRSASELAAAGDAPHRLVRSVHAILAWWSPFLVQYKFDMTWPDVAFVVSPPLPLEKPAVPTDDILLLQLAGELTGVHRRAAVPSRTWVSLESETSQIRARHELVLANSHLDRFLVNTGPWRANLRVDRRGVKKGNVELSVTALCRSPNIELLARPGTLDEIWLDGKVLTPQPLVRAPQLWRCQLQEPLRVGKTYKLTCLGRVEPAQVWVNPVLVEAAKFQARRRVYIPDYWSESQEEGMFPDLIAGQDGIVIHYQPFYIPASKPAETDSEVLARARRVMLGRRTNRRADLSYLVRELVPGVHQATCCDGEWFEQQDGWRKEVKGVRVTIIPKTEAAGDPATVKSATERFLKSHLSAAIPTRVELKQEQSV